MTIPHDIRGLRHDLVEDQLRHVRVGEAAPSVLPDHGGIRDAVREPAAQKPPVGDIDGYLLDEPPLTPDPEQVADEQHLEQDLRLDRRAAVVFAAVRAADLVDEGEVDDRIDPSEQVAFGHEFFDCDELGLSAV